MANHTLAKGWWSETQTVTQVNKNDVSGQETLVAILHKVKLKNLDSMDITSLSWRLHWLTMEHFNTDGISKRWQLRWAGSIPTNTFSSPPISLPIPYWHPLTTFPTPSLSFSLYYPRVSLNSRIPPVKGRVKLIFLALAKKEISWCQSSTMRTPPYLAR